VVRRLSLHVGPASRFIVLLFGTSGSTTPAEGCRAPARLIPSFEGFVSSFVFSSLEQIAGFFGGFRDIQTRSIRTAICPPRSKTLRSCRDRGAHGRKAYGWLVLGDGTGPPFKQRDPMQFLARRFAKVFQWIDALTGSHQLSEIGDGPIGPEIGVYN
jgi:hypothetical protein